MGSSFWCWLPILGAVLALTTVTTCYAIIVTQDNVDPILPYISRAGEYIIARNLFGWGLSLYASSVFVVALLKWELNQELARRQRASRALRRANHAAAVFGVLAALNVTLLANFNMRDTLDVHNATAVTAFVCMTTYAVISIVLQRKLDSRTLYWPRLVLVSLGVLSFAALIVFFAIWPPSNPKGWTGAIAEWSMCTSLIVYVGSFAADFRSMRLQVHLGDRSSNAIMLADRDGVDDVFA
jgi:peptidoglycan/LPS O-acetylase OafA/YrhL